MAKSQLERPERTRSRSRLSHDHADRRRVSTRARVLIFVVVCAVAVGASLISFLHGRDSVTHTGVAVATGAPLRTIGARSELLFRSTALDKNFGAIAAVPAQSEKGARQLSTLDCDRVDFVNKRGICLKSSTQPFAFATDAVIFDSRFHTLHTVELAGLSSRARISPDGRYAATTTFVHGDSYADAGFSTRTSIIDMRNGSIVLDLEKLAVTNDGEPFHNVDFNFWGVTFVADSTRFYATLGTGGEAYLIAGNVATGKARVLRSGVECPSLSPDGTRIAFKKRNPGTTVTWRLSVLDVATLTDHPLTETRSVDDQVQWLDNETVMYGLPGNAGELSSVSAATPGVPILGGQSSIETNTWTVPADGGGVPKKLISGAWSTVPVGA